jgi:hypothetical protein
MTMAMFLREPRTKGNKKAGALAAIGAAIAAASGVFSSSNVRGVRLHPGDIGSTSTLLLFSAAILIPVVAFVVVRMIRRGENDQPSGEEMSTTASSDTAHEEENGAPRILLAILGAIIALVIALFAWTKEVHAQGVSDRGALFIRMGADTVVADRFTRTGDTLWGQIGRAHV